MATTQNPVCRDEQQRRADILAHPDPLVNGTDFVEVDPTDHSRLTLTLLRPAPPANPADPNDADDIYGLSAQPQKITITGGTRVVGIHVLSVTRQADGRLEITVDTPGDFSFYTLTVNGVSQFDPLLRRVQFSFMAACPSDFDCRQDLECPPASLQEPLIDYLAKDYASFRKLLLDLIPQLNPRFEERNPSDLGIALVELLAYAGDHLSYFQDAVANEAYLQTVRRRISARRHALLVDYRVHDGRNAWTFAHFRVNAVPPGLLAKGVAVLTKVAAPLRGELAPPALWIDASRITAEALETDPALGRAVVFETTHEGRFDPANNRIFIHSWGNQECCLSPGSLQAYLYSVNPATGLATRPDLQSGDYLLFEEVKGPKTANPADADPLHRQVVQIDEEPEDLEDPLYANTLVDGALQRFELGLIPLPLARVRWRAEDALTFPLCLSSRPAGQDVIRNISVARGNMVLLDHGLTATETIDLTGLGSGPGQMHPRLARGPLTMRAAPSETVRDATPSISLSITFDGNPQPQEFSSVPHLLDSPPLARHFVVEVDDQLRSSLRFGDGEYGREISNAVSLEATYRIGNGRAGNIGAESLAHLALGVAPAWLDEVRNPLAARGGVDPETIEEVRQRAPQAFHAEQFRAVTEGDYAAAARKLKSVAGAVATFRWTGSWYTVFVGVDPNRPEDLIYEPGGRIRLASHLEREVRAFLTRYRLAGYDLEIRPPQFVPLELDLQICALRSHFRFDVAQAVAETLSSRTLASGRKGFFHPDNFTFGQPVYLSQIYAAVEAVEGVDSAVVTRFRRFGQPDNGELDKGVMPIDSWEIAQLENDPNFMEHGVLRLQPRGGKA